LTVGLLLARFSPESVLVWITAAAMPALGSVGVLRLYGVKRLGA